MLNTLLIITDHRPQRSRFFSKIEVRISAVPYSGQEVFWNCCSPVHCYLNIPTNGYADKNDLYTVMRYWWKHVLSLTQQYLSLWKACADVATSTRKWCKQKDVDSRLQVGQGLHNTWKDTCLLCKAFSMLLEACEAQLVTWRSCQFDTKFDCLKFSGQTPVGLMELIARQISFSSFTVDWFCSFFPVALCAL